MVRLAGTPSILSWPLPISFQAQAIVNATAAYKVPIQVFMGMYDNETTLGANVANSGVGASGGAAGPFQFEAGTGRTYGYPRTNTPTSTEFVAQANAAAHYLHDLFVDFIPSLQSWQNALAGYNAGAGNFRLTQAQDYAARALAFKIPIVWAAALGVTPGASQGTATAGGTANAGGTGTLLNDSSGFTVGDPTNPDEDFWTALNRLAQDRYWYLFSDSETLYLADGPDLMKQTPAMSVDRIADMSIISSLQFTFDNTAWTYAATHKKRRRTQRRTALAKITSPVEGILDAVCKVDEVRAGDVMVFSNTGPGDGQWLVGDCRRSVFEVMSEITVVPALTPLSEGELNPAGQNQNNLSAYATPINDTGYVNPVGLWTPTRVDQGVDGTLKGPYMAPADSTIVLAQPSNAGWGPIGGPGGGWIVGRITSGALKGKYWYVAEGIYPLIAQGTNVQAGTPVGRTVINPFNQIPGNIETGWADPNNPGRPLSQSLPTYATADPAVKRDQSPAAIACGNSFNRWLIKLKASPGSIQGQGVGVVPSPMPPGYP